MHSVNKKTGQKTALRIVAYIVTIFLTLSATAILMLIALGYRFDSKAGEVEVGGLALIDSKPESARVDINGQLEDNATPTRSFLLSGDYNIDLTRNGYKKWSKKLKVKPSSVNDLSYALLIPNEIKLTKTQSNVTTPQMVSQSPSKTLVLVHQANNDFFTLLKLGGDKLETSKIRFTEEVESVDSSFGKLKAIEWSDDNRSVLVQQKLANGDLTYLKVNVRGDGDVVNLGQLYGPELPDNLHFVAGENSEVYGLKDGVLSRYDTQKAQINLMVRDVVNYSVGVDKTVAINQFLKKNGTARVVLYKDGKATPVISTKSDRSSIKLMDYSEYDGDKYLTIATSKDTKVSMYRNPLYQPQGFKNKPFYQFDSKINIARVQESPDGKFILIAGSKKALVYDLKNLVPYRLSASSKNGYKWLNSYHLIYANDKGKDSIVDYDGFNFSEIVSSSSLGPVMFSQDLKTIYQYKTVNQDSDKANLLTASMLSSDDQ